MAKPGAAHLVLVLAAYCCLLARAFVVPAAPLSRARTARFNTALEAVKDAKSPEEFDKVRACARRFGWWRERE